MRILLCRLRRPAEDAVEEPSTMNGWNFWEPEGDLTSLRASLVNATMLGNIAGDLGYNKFLLLSRGEAKDVGRARQYILANAFESVTGAIYLDRGYEEVEVNSPGYRFKCIGQNILP